MGQMTPLVAQRGGSARRRRGLVLLLTAIVLVFLAILGAMFLAMARGQRPEVTQPIDNIDLVLDAEIAALQQTLTDDVISPNGIWFEPAEGVEPFDFGRTNYDASTERTITSPFGGSLTVRGGENDDQWLAETVPSRGANHTVWGRVPSQRGYFVGGASGSSDLTTADNATGFNEYPINGSNALNSDNNGGSGYGLSNAVLFDADGDGINDTRLERAAIPFMTGREYVVAVRPVDLSSLVPLLAGTALTSDGVGADETAYGYSATNIQPVRAWWQTSIDLSRVAAARTTNWQSDLGTLFASSLRESHDPSAPGNPIATATFPTPINDRWESWRYDASINGSEDTLRQHAASLVNLHYRNGFDRVANDDIIEQSTGGLLDAPASYANQAGDGSYNPAPSATNHFNSFGNLRHLVTTLSGAIPYAYDWGRATGGTPWAADGRLLQLDPNTLASLGNYPAIDNHPVRQRLEDIFSLSGSAGQYGADWSTATNATIKSYWYTLCLKDYLDEDGVPSAWLNPTNGVYYCGVEPLPMLREAYMQLGYVNDGAGTMTAVPGSAGYVIELGNPFDRPIPLDADEPGEPEIRLIVVSETAPGTWQIDSTYELKNSGFNQIPARPSNADSDDEHLLIISNPTTPVADGSAATGIVIDNLEDQLGISTTNANVVTLAPSDALSHSYGKKVWIGLQVKIDSRWMTYDRLRDITIRTSFTARGAGLNFDGGHLAVSYKRPGTRNEYLSNKGKDWVWSFNDAHWPAGPNGEDPGFASRAAAFATNEIDDLNEDNKTSATNTSPVPLTGDPSFSITDHYSKEALAFHLPVANRRIYSVAEMAHVPTMGFWDRNLNDRGGIATVLGGDDRVSMSPLPIDDRFLNLKSSNVVSSQLNHASIALGHFSTLVPTTDQVDNDSDGNADAADSDGGEELVFGQVNLNTAPELLYKTILPYPMPTQTNWLYGQWSSAIGSAGIPHMPSLLNVAGLHGTYKPNVATYYLAYDLRDGSTDFGGGTGGAAARDLYPTAESQASDAAEDYRIVDDAEDDVLLYQFFTQPFTNRSDIFACHIYVAGYDHGGYDRGVVESARAVVVIDRSNLRSATDTGRVLAIYRY